MTSLSTERPGGHDTKIRPRRWRGACLAFLPAVAFLLFGATEVCADLITKTASITDISIATRSMPNGPNQILDLGNMSISLADDGPASLMNATFTINPTFANSSLDLWRDVSLHWLQLIWHGNNLANYNGAFPNLPVIDPPKGGWDYMYNDGAGRTQPNNAIPDFGWFIDDQPWYFNTVGEAANSTRGQSYSVLDRPGDRTAPDFIGFTTYLVATDPKLCNAPGCLTPTEILVLAGFDWTESNLNIAITDPFATPRLSDVADITISLLNGGFGGWTVTDSKAALIPEPSTLVLLLTGMLLLVWARKRHVDG